MWVLYLALMSLSQKYTNIASNENPWNLFLGGNKEFEKVRNVPFIIGGGPLNCKQTGLLGRRLMKACLSPRAGCANEPIHLEHVVP